MMMAMIEGDEDDDGGDGNSSANWPFVCHWLPRCADLIAVDPRFKFLGL